MGKLLSAEEVEASFTYQTINITLIKKDCACGAKIRFDMDFDTGIGKRCYYCDEIMCDKCFTKHKCSDQGIRPRRHV